MPISITLDLSALVHSITEEHQAAIAEGGLDGDEVWYEYVTQHDDRVRPSHAALDGSVWKVGDPFAPVPPIAYGCRCSMKYCAAPDSIAARVLPPAPEDKVLLPRGEVFATYLDEHVERWKELGKLALKLSPGERTGALLIALKAAGVKDPSDIAMMILEAVRPKG